MRAAIELAHMGCPVTLIERDHFTGGRVAQWDILFTSDQTGREIVSRLYNEINNSKNITLLTGAEVISNKGSIGNFRLQVKIKPRYIKDHFDDDKLKKVIAVCPVEVPDEYNFNVTNRKAIYQNPGQYPKYPVIDIKNCTRCGECEKVCDNIDFSLKEEVIEVEAGSILVATGFDPYIPQDGEFGYNEIDNVITLPQFKRLIDLCHNDLLFNGKAIKSIAYIYCVGSRQSEGENKYCSRYCCTSAIHTSIQVKKNFKNVKNFHFTRGIRTYGKQELLYYESQKDGDIYLQSYEENPLMVSTENGKICVKINDILTGNREISVEPDLVVLVTGIVPRSDTSISQIFKLPGGRDRFFNEIHPKLRPVETVIDGITIAGTCQGPKNVTESLNSGLSAATKSFSLVNKGELELEPIIAEIDKNKCTWCGECEKACPFDAIRMVKQGDKDVAAINNSVCKGCGMCLPVCPVNAINLISYSDKEIESMIDSLAGKG
jgi:heterodisulfide reductase subunit A